MVKMILKIICFIMFFVMFLSLFIFIATFCSNDSTGVLDLTNIVRYFLVGIMILSGIIGCVTAIIIKK